MKTEIEYKLIIESKDAIRQKLRRLKATQKYPDTLMRMCLFDYPSKREMNLAGQYKWWRVRDEGSRITVTLKEIYDDGERKDDHAKELEVVVDDFENACELLEHTGMLKTANQEKYQEVWELGEIEFSIDTWPTLPPFIEIEGSDEDAMRRLVAELGLAEADIILGPVDYVFREIYGVEPDVLGEYRELTFATEDDVRKRLQAAAGNLSR